MTVIKYDYHRGGGCYEYEYENDSGEKSFFYLGPPPAKKSYHL